ncbi:hypothetical protein HK099_008111 [Clydaea vesicula]|uniref:UspA domain-containing protein n=1 Tax=Clydaea vesicula TaxID=447962 RepID=A0AAD5XXQ3_9FUNG|nr:hypothetical protein HK099_008111 [Clydaea vesicula]
MEPASDNEELKNTTALTESTESKVDHTQELASESIQKETTLEADVSNVKISNPIEVCQQPISTAETANYSSEKNESTTLLKKRRIIIAVDQSSHSEKTINWAINNFINPETDKITLINVRSDVNDFFRLFTEKKKSTFEEELENQYRSESHNLIKTFGSLMIRNKISCKGFSMVGDARELIIKKAEEEKADVLIIGCKGSGKLNLFGTTAEHCIKNCTCPVICIR